MAFLIKSLYRLISGYKIYCSFGYVAFLAFLSKFFKAYYIEKVKFTKKTLKFIERFFVLINSATD